MSVEEHLNRKAMEDVTRYFRTTYPHNLASVMYDICGVFCGSSTHVLHAEKLVTTIILDRSCVAQMSFKRGQGSSVGILFGGR